MNKFGQLADDLTDMIEELEASEHADLATPLCRALQRAFIKACELDRLLRKRHEANGQNLSDSVQLSTAA
jgi:hypothetical protein